MSENDRRQSEIYFSGRVQGVGFRYTVHSLARGFQVTGYVRNLSDGRVQVVVEGEQDEIEAFFSAIKTEMASYIRDIQESDRPASGRFSSFEVRF